MAKANHLLGKDDHVVAVIGDGALTGGMAWEALNNIAADKDRRLVVIVNDNGRSYTPTVGGLANRLTEIRTNPKYEPALSAIKERLNRTRFGGTQAYEALHAIKKGVKDALAPQGMFEDLGLKYIGPVDGHDREAHRARADPGQEVRRTGPGPRPDHQGPRLRHRGRQRERPDAPGAAVRPRDR